MSTVAESFKMTRSGQAKLISVLSAVFIAATFFCVGYAVCAGVPAVCEAAARMNATEEGSAFTQDALVEGAMATREYSFGSHDEEAYFTVIAQMNQECETPYASASLDEIKAAPETYTVTPEALTHLDDVYDLSSRLMFPVIGIALVAGFLLMASYTLFGSTQVARALLWGGAVMLILIVVLALWACVSFESLFAVFHSLFFANGSWVFSADSLLITMLPTGFWTTMALVWAGITALLSAISVVAACVLTRRQAKDGSKS